MESRKNEASLFEIFKIFFSIGLFTIGGGVAMIPIMEKELSDKKGWLTTDEFINVLALAQTSPGPLAVNTSVFIGYKLKGFIGAVISTLATTLPSLLIMLLIAFFLRDIRSIKAVDSVFMGIRPAVVALLFSSIIGISKKSKLRKFDYLIVLGVLILLIKFKISPVLIISVGGGLYVLYSVFVENKR